jgi:hypothetical protein
VDFVWRAGVHVEGSGLWFDAPRAHDLCFLSSAQAFVTHGRASVARSAVLCSERTWRLCQALDARAAARSLLLSPPGRPFSLGALRLELFPAGGLRGATSLWLRLPSGQTIAYAGAPNPNDAFSEAAGGEPMQLRSAETLVCHAPLATTDARLPSLEQAQQALWTEITHSRSESAVTVLLCPPVLMAKVLHDTLARAARDEASEAKWLFGDPRVQKAVSALGDDESAIRLRRFNRPLGSGQVLLWPLLTDDRLPPIARLAQEDVGGVRIFLCTGAGLLSEVEETCRKTLHASGLELTSVLPFPDVIDREGLLRYVKATDARRLYLTTGFSDALAAQLGHGRKGIEVAPLGPPHQLRLLT